MVDADFTEGIKAENFLTEAIEKAPKLNAFDANLLMYDMYETTYGIYNHKLPHSQRPWASIALHEGEDICETSSLNQTIEAYHGRGIIELFGLSLIEYLSLPSDMCITLMEIAAREGARKHAANVALAAKMNADGMPK